MKYCSQCEEAKPAVEFNRNSRSADGLRPSCRACQGAQDAARRARIGVHGWRQRSRTQYAANSNAINQRQIRRRRERVASRLRHVEEQARRRVRNAGGDVEPLDYLAIGERQQWTCALCHHPVDIDDASFDHIVPASRGGHHIESNVQLTHLRCNLSKGTRLMHELAVSGAD